MKVRGATAAVFWTALDASPTHQQPAMIARLLGDKEFVQDLTDLALIEHSRCEPGTDAVI